MRYCKLCNQRNEKNKRAIIERHHIQYSPAVVVDLCRSCHSIISNYLRNPSVYNIEEPRFEVVKFYLKLRAEMLASDMSDIVATTMVVSFRLQDSVMEWLQTRSRGKPIAGYIKAMVMKAYESSTNQLISDIKTSVQPTEILDKLEGRLRALGLKMEGKKIVGVNKCLKI